MARVFLALLALLVAPRVTSASEFLFHRDVSRIETSDQRQNSASLRPFKASVSYPGRLHRRHDGLLWKRQLTCNPGFHLCDGTDGCCSNSDTCTSDGGCCPNGEICGPPGGSSACEDPSDEPCSGDTFCCPVGDLCFRDQNNNPACTSGSSTSPFPPSMTTLAALPSPTTGTSNTFVSLDDPSMTWSGPWSSVSGACNKTAPALKCSSSDLIANSSLVYDFTGSAIYVMLANSNAWYLVGVNNDFTFFKRNADEVVTDPVTPKNCTYIAWTSTSDSASNSGINSLTVIPFGTDLNSDLSNSFTPWWFEVQSIVVEQLDSEPSPSNPTVIPSPTPSHSIVNPPIPINSKGSLALGFRENISGVSHALIALVLLLMFIA